MLCTWGQALGLQVDLSVDKKDYEGFARLVRSSFTPGGTFVAAWQHTDIPFLIKALGVPNAGDFSIWPNSCDSQSWQEPPYIAQSNSCYDAMWQVRFSQSSSGEWLPGPASVWHEGFGGSAQSPCAEGLQPEGDTQYLLSNI